MTPEIIQQLIDQLESDNPALQAVQQYGEIKEAIVRSVSDAVMRDRLFKFLDHQLMQAMYRISK